MSVCLYVCITITFESLDVEFASLVSGDIFTGYGSSSYMKVIGSRSRSQQEKTWNSLFPQCKTSVGSSFGSIEIEL